jgi:hypothetical protein
MERDDLSFERSAARYTGRSNPSAAAHTRGQKSYRGGSRWLGDDWKDLDLRSEYYPVLLSCLLMASCCSLAAVEGGGAKTVRLLSVLR